MKKITYVLLTLLLVFCLFSCDGESVNNKNSESEVLTTDQVIAASHADNIMSLADKGFTSCDDKYFNGYYYTGNITVNTTTYGLNGKTVSADVTASKEKGSTGDSIKTTIDVSSDGTETIKSLEYNGTKINVEAINNTKQTIDQIYELIDLVEGFVDNFSSFEAIPSEIVGSADLCIDDEIVVTNKKDKVIFSLDKNSSITATCSSSSDYNISGNISGTINGKDYSVEASYISNKVAFSGTLGTKEYSILKISDFLDAITYEFEKIDFTNINSLSGKIRLSNFNLDVTTDDNQYSAEIEGDLSISVSASGILEDENQYISYSLSSNGFNIKVTDSYSNEFISFDLSALSASKAFDADDLYQNPTSISEFYNMLGIDQIDFVLSFKTGSNKYSITNEECESVLFYLMNTSFSLI